LPENHPNICAPSRPHEPWRGGGERGGSGETRNKKKKKKKERKKKKKKREKSKRIDEYQDVFSFQIDSLQNLQGNEHPLGILKLTESERFGFPTLITDTVPFLDLSTDLHKKREKGGPMKSTGSKRGKSTDLEQILNKGVLDSLAN